MTIDTNLRSAAYWRDRAEETLSVSESLHDPEARRILREISRSYEELARRAEQRERKVDGYPK